MPGANVRTLHILPPSPGKARFAMVAADSAPQPTMPAGPVRTRENASDGYHRALAAHRRAVPPCLMDPAIAEAVERQTAAMRELSRRAFQDPKVAPDAAAASIETASAYRRQADVSHTAALRRARVERAQQGRSAATIRCTRPEVAGQQETSDAHLTVPCCA